MGLQSEDDNVQLKELVSLIVDALIQERKRRGITQQEIADISGMKAPNITRIESCRYVPTLNVLLRYAEALDMDLTFQLVDRAKEE